MIELFRPPDKPTPSLRPRKVLKLSILYKYGFQTLRGRSEGVGLFGSRNFLCGTLQSYYMIHIAFQKADEPIGKYRPMLELGDGKHPILGVFRNCSHNCSHNCLMKSLHCWVDQIFIRILRNFLWFSYFI